jgi:hypothetical protein
MIDPHIKAFETGLPPPTIAGFEQSSQKDPIPSGDQAETRSAVNSHGPKEEVDSPSIAAAEYSGPQELESGMSAADVADKEALCAVEAVWRRASARARKRIVVFVTAEMRAIVEAQRSRKAGETGG